MVTPVSRPRNDRTALDKPTLVMELVGPAGTGKTTLLQALCQRSKGIPVVASPRVRRSKYFPFFVRNAVLLLPTLLRPHRHGRRFTYQEIVTLAKLNGWHHTLARQASRNGRIIVLDQGPVFLLSWLWEFGPESLNYQSSAEWWDNMIGLWAAALDAVIRLDAPDSVLTERINTRTKPHPLKGKPEQEMCGFMARGRTSVDEIISRLTAGAGPRVLCFDTSSESPDQIAEKVLAALGLEPSHG